MCTLVTKEKKSRRSFVDRLVRDLRLNREESIIEALADLQVWRSLPKDLVVQIGYYVTRSVAPEFRFEESSALTQSESIEFTHVSSIKFCLVPGRLASTCHVCNGRAAFAGGELCEFCGGTGRLEAVTPQFVAKSQITQEEFNNKALRDLKPLVNVPVLNMEEWIAERGWGIPKYDDWLHLMFGDSPDRYFWGSSLRPSYVWYAKNSNSELKPTDLHCDKANRFGLIDVVGNAWELLDKDGPVACGGSFATEVKFLNARRVYRVEFDTKSPELSLRPCRSLLRREG